MRDEKWLKRYVFTKLHETFFGEFLIILNEWLEILVENIEIHRIIVPRYWTLDLVRQLNSVSYNTSHVFDF
jgi:hypothetical protein